MRTEKERIFAAIDLVKRGGAKDLEVGYLHDNVPSEEADWWAKAGYQGARIGVEGHKGPLEALEALAQKILTGAKCGHCGGLVALSKHGAFFPSSDPDEPVLLADGTEWTLREAAQTEQCLWQREGTRWIRGCSD